MRGHYDPRRPLQPPVGGWPALNHQSAGVLTRIGELLSAAASFSGSLDLDARFACLYGVLESVGDQIHTGRIVELSEGSLDDPLALFCLDFAALCFILDDKSLKRMKRKLAKRNFGLPIGINPEDLRSKPLVALHKVIQILDGLVGELVYLDPKKVRNRTVH